MRLPTHLKLFAPAVVLAVVLVALAAQPAWAGHGDDCAALHEAAFLDEPDEARALLDHGADVNCLDVLGQTPLVTAVNGASVETFDVLLGAGARTDVRTEFGQTLLAHTKKKHAAFAAPSGEALRSRYATMLARLQRADTVN